MLITTNINPTEKALRQVRQLSIGYHIKYVERGNITLSKLMRVHSANVIIVVSELGLKVINKDGREIHFHPGMAKVRISSIKKGLGDRMIEVSNVCEGDYVLDCTGGLGVDSIVFSYMVGEKGNVTTIESEIIPYLMLRDGVKNYTSRSTYLTESVQRINVVYSDHNKYLLDLKDKSFDIVYFDPMFEKPLKAVSLEGIRDYTNKNRLELSAIKEAVRIARKKIILKNRYDSDEFNRLGFKQIYDNNQSGIAYGVINI